MKKGYRALVWMILIVLGFAVTIWTAIYAKNGSAWVPVGIAVCAVWGALAFASGWYFGVARFVREHLGHDFENATFVEKDIGASRMADFVQLLEHLYEDQNATRYGLEIVKLSQLKTSNSEVTAVDWTTLEGVEGDLLNIPSNAIYLLHYEGKPFVARAAMAAREYDHFAHEEAWTTGAGQMLEIVSESLESANKIIRWMTDQASEHSVYRGHMLSVASPKDGSTGQTIRITERPSTERDRIVIDEKILALLDRLINVSEGKLNRLEKMGHRPATGVLMHGPPGTGKTLVTRYIIGLLSEHSIIVPADLEVETLRACFRLAKYLPPAVIIIEDVDLLARERDGSKNTDGLQELMNQMDGISEGSNAIVLMSTNQPSLLEPALAARPGRVSQAIEFPLPGVDERKKLLRLFLCETISSKLSHDSWVGRIDGASPAFIEELCRRSILVALDREEQRGGRPADRVEVLDEDMEQAIHELIVTGGKLTASVLGFPEQS